MFGSVFGSSGVNVRATFVGVDGTKETVVTVMEAVPPLGAVLHLTVDEEKIEVSDRMDWRRFKSDALSGEITSWLVDKVEVTHRVFKESVVDHAAQRWEVVLKQIDPEEETDA